MKADGSPPRPFRLTLHLALLALVGMALLPVVLLTIWSNLLERDRAREGAVQSAAHVASMVASSLSGEARNARLVLYTLARTKAMRSGSPASMHDQVIRQARLAPEFDNIVVAAPDGRVLFAAQESAYPPTLYENQAFLDILGGQSFAVGTGLTSLPSGHPHAQATFAAPVFDEANNLRYIIAAQSPLERLHRDIHMEHLPKDTSMMLADANGRVLFRVPSLPGYNNLLLPQNHLAVVHRREPQHQGWDKGLDGKDRYYVMQRLELSAGMACYVRVGIPRGEIYAASDATLVRNLTTLFLITVFTLIISRVWGTRHLLWPAERLHSAVTRMGHGDLSARTGLADATGITGELGELARTFDHMAERLEKNQAEQQAAREAVLRSEARLRAIFNASADGMLLLSPDGTVLAMNECAAIRRGRAPDELEGRNILELIPPEARGVRHSGLLQVTASGRPVRFEEEREGRTYALRLFPLTNADGTVRQIASFSRDITERKLNEQALRVAKDAAEAASRAKSNFLSNISHELRTPLNGLLGMLQLMDAPDLAEEQKEYLDWASQSAQQLSKLVNDILEFASIETDRMTLELRPFCMAEVMVPIVDENRAASEAKGLSFRAEFQPMVMDLLILGDPVQLGQILRHLASNALKFTEQGGVEFEATILTRTENTVTVCLCITDTGIGIGVEDLERIFDPFVQGDAPLTKRYQGTGLGLASARELVARMGGTLSVKSTLGKGSTFSVCISFQLAGAQPQAGPACEQKDV